MNGQMSTYSKGDIVVNKGVTRAESELSDALITAINNFFRKGLGIRQVIAILSVPI